jgi:hypothetical protein
MAQNDKNVSIAGFRPANNLLRPRAARVLTRGKFKDFSRKFQARK